MAYSLSASMCFMVAVGGGGGGGGASDMCGIVRMCVSNNPFFQRRQLYDKLFF